MKYNMPFNGEVVFHEIMITIPNDFVRDSTQSNEDLWIFEKGLYSKYIILSRKDMQGDSTEVLEGYIEYLTEQGVTARKEKFMQIDAVYDCFEREDLFCQEIIFIYEDSIYAIALRGATEEEFKELLETVVLGETDLNNVMHKKLVPLFTEM